MAEVVRAGSLAASSFDTKWLWCVHVESLLLKIAKIWEISHAGVDLIMQVRHSGVDPNGRARVVCPSFGYTDLRSPLPGVSRISFNANIIRKVRGCNILK